MMMERCGRKRSWINLRYYAGICLEVLEKTTKTLSQNRRSTGRDLNPGPPEYEVRVLTTAFGEAAIVCTHEQTVVLSQRY
jgi:hypothetical protein